MVENFYQLARKLSRDIERFVEYEEGGEGVTLEETQMFKALRECNDYLKEYIDTQKATERKFEIGKAYLDKWCDLHRVTSVTKQSVYFDGSRKSVYTDENGNQHTSDWKINA